MNRTAIEEEVTESAGSSIRDLSNDALIIRLLQTVNHLSRWLTPIHDPTALEFSARRSEPSVKELLIRLRDTETRAYGFMNAIANERDPDLDRVPRVEPSPAQTAVDRSAHPLVIMSEFRRVRESSDIPAAGAARHRLGPGAATAARSETGQSASWRSSWPAMTGKCCSASTAP